ncbi:MULTISPECIES: PD-(D/E)XK nuclease-like domain-containing protein [unclassified Streptomyces]|uniref:PD-(D/E)XK nuclease-like domain-containing protein n=1 Tax=unclassified Streptomyces TaxID=2593676 RepID=UPI00136906EA|nr:MULTISPECIES: PD-(D/E)XK nuclease-like domain-containing protein [unclassified Streptomyces]NEA03697.1 hypothetical protein [Streptomyces sp. SID10116]MYY79697.1 hypothetical protein [Streptomyces sp. SID335]MYZ12829.1 hypothetical protein [Streptomyces sp. SID337]NDZ91133.1 hypothetical protein [Streptomyces sp. SID10115]NEB43530.1 hypothetical protein [Streptomyces sp. SID339]
MTAAEVEAPAEVEPGVYDNVASEVYHADPVPDGSLSSTGARKLATECPAAFKHWVDHPEPYKSAFDFGTAAHKVVLGDGPELVLVDRDRWDTNEVKEQIRKIRAAGNIPLKQRDLDKVNAMAEALRAHPEAAALLEPGSGIAERTIIWNDRGVWRRIRIDWARHDGTLVDYKSCRSANPSKLPNHIADYGYHQQQEYYRDGALEFGLTELVCPFKFIFQEKEPPYLVSVIELDSTACGIGRHLNERALNTYALCRAADDWPGYVQTPLVSLPPRVEREYR